MNSGALKATRKTNGYLQGYVAERLGISISSYRNKESGKTRFDSREIAVLANLLQLDYQGVNEIFFDDELPNKVSQSPYNGIDCAACPLRCLYDAILACSEGVKNGT